MGLLFNNSMTSLEAVFWDVDGTISDTEINGHRVAFNKAFNELNLNWYWNENEYIDLLKITGGKNRLKYFSSINNYDISELQISHIYEFKKRYYKKLQEDNKLLLRTGVFRLINDLYLSGIQQCIVTSSSRDSVEFMIKNCLSLKYNPFSFIISSEDVQHNKPHSEPYDLALNKSGLDNRNIIVIEDSLPGLISATAANLTCLVTLTSWNKNDLSEYHSAISVVDSLGEDCSRSHFFKGPKSNSGFVDISFLENCLL